MGLLSMPFAGIRRLAEHFRIQNASEETTRDYQARLQSEVIVCRDQNILLQQENDELKRQSDVLMISKKSLKVKYEQVQQQLILKKLDAVGSNADGLALLESTVKDLMASVSSLVKELCNSNGPFSEHFRRLNLNPHQKLTTHFGGAFLDGPAATYRLKAWLFEIFFTDFENERFLCGGATLFLDRTERKEKSFEYFHKVNAVDSKFDFRCFDSEFETFCDTKFRDFLSLWQWSFVSRRETYLGHEPCKMCVMYMNGLSTLTSVELEPPTRDLIRSFVSTAKLVWALHKLCMSFEPRANIFRVQNGAPFKEDYMESVVNREDRYFSKVGFMIFPGFQLRKPVVKCQTYLEDPPDPQYSLVYSPVY